MRLRYTGGRPTVFLGVAQVEDGDTFEAPAALAKRLLRRTDVQRATQPSAPTTDPVEGTV